MKLSSVKYPARILINNVANDDMFTKRFLFKMYTMGAHVTVHADIFTTLDTDETKHVTLYLEDKNDYYLFGKLP